MSHFSVLVALRATDPANIKAALGEVLAPFDENREVTPYYSYEDGNAADYWSVESCREKGLLPSEGDLSWKQVAEAVNVRWEHEPDSSEYLRVDDDGRAYTLSRYNPASKWDWWEVGGRWTGYFVPAVSAEDSRLLLGRPGVFGTPAAPGHVDGGPRQLLDFGAMRAEKAAQAGAQYDRWTEFTHGVPDAEPWSLFLAKHMADKESYPIEQARKDYGSQDVVIKARTSREFSWLDDVVEAFAVSREDYTASAAMRAVPGYAFVGLDGVWQAPGEMGWFGFSSDSDPERDAYYEHMNQLLDDLAPTTILVAIDCHI